jgi:hypothetical protein
MVNHVMLGEFVSKALFWATIKRDFRDGSITAIVETARKLFEAYSSKKIEAVLNGEGFSL